MSWLLQSLRTEGVRVLTHPEFGFPHAEQIVEAIAERLAQVMPRAADDEKAQLAPSLIRTLPLAFRS